MQTFPYTVRPGDTLTKIALLHGLRSWREIYHHPDNAAFRAKRPNPDRIYPNDVVRIPRTGPATSTCGPPAVAVQPASGPSFTYQGARPTTKRLSWFAFERDKSDKDNIVVRTKTDPFEFQWRATIDINGKLESTYAVGFLQTMLAFDCVLSYAKSESDAHPVVVRAVLRPLPIRDHAVKSEFKENGEWASHTSEPDGVKLVGPGTAGKDFQSQIRVQHHDNPGGRFPCFLPKDHGKRLIRLVQRNLFSSWLVARPVTLPAFRLESYVFIHHAVWKVDRVTRTIWHRASEQDYPNGWRPDVEIEGGASVVLTEAGHGQMLPLLTPPDANEPSSLRFVPPF